MGREEYLGRSLPLWLPIALEETEKVMGLSTHALRTAGMKLGLPQAGTALPGSNCDSIKRFNLADIHGWTFFVENSSVC